MNTDIAAIQITHNADGTLTLSGVHRTDLIPLLNAASLYRHDHPAKAEPLTGQYDETQHANNLQAFSWHLEQEMLIEVLTAKLKAAVDPKYNPAVDRDRLDYIKEIHDFKVGRLEQIVSDAEVAAAKAKAAKEPDLVGQAAERLAIALRQADAALAGLNRARAK